MGTRASAEAPCSGAGPTERLALRVLTAADALSNRLYGSRWNPLYQSGTIVVALYLALLVTGLWLILFYRVGSPWESVAALTDRPWVGNWVRGVHRYASDLAVVFTAVHAFRMFAQGRSWGARTLAWVSGGVLLLLLFVCGWTGYVMVWDVFGQQLAREGARLIDALPFLSEPTSRAFTGEQRLPSAFFFLALFAHIGVPLGMGVVLWLHVTRVARPVLLPPRPLLWTVIGSVAALAIAWPLRMAPQANAFVLPETVPTDLFFGFWLLPTRGVRGGVALPAAAALVIAGLSIPLFTARRGTAAPPKSIVDEDVCVGCLQCALDCPYEAIAMIPRADRPSELVARVDPARCVSCGICAGSCAPMGVGPPGRGGRDQMAQVRAFVAARGHRAGQVVVVACAHSAGAWSTDVAAHGGAVYPVECAGDLHTSVIEMLLRGGAGGVLVAGCPLRDCWHREGPRWLVERVHHGREAELQARVDRARVRLVRVGAGECRALVSALRAFTDDIAALDRPAVQGIAPPEVQCQPVLVEESREAV